MDTLVHPTDLLVWLQKTLKVAEKNQRFIANITSKAAVPVKVAAAEQYDMIKFVKRYPELFLLNRDETIVRLKVREHIPSSSQLSEALKRFVPKFGFLLIEDFCRLLHPKLRKSYVISHLSNDPSCAEIFDLQKACSNSEKEYIIRKKFWESTGGRVSLGDNSTCIKAPTLLKIIKSFAPNFWVPFPMLLRQGKMDANLDEHRWHNSVNVSQALGFCDEVLEMACLRNDPPYVRKWGATRSVEEEENKWPIYEAYDLHPKLMLKLAFSLPTTPVSVLYAQGAVFPSVMKWGAKCAAFSLSDLAQMYPKAINIEPYGKVSSALRMKYPHLAPSTEQAFTLEAEAEFEAKLMKQSPETIKELNELVSEPSDKLFQRKIFRLVRKDDVVISKDAPVLEPSEILDALDLVLNESHDPIRLYDLMIRLRDFVPADRYRKIKNTITLKHRNSLLKFVKRFPERLHVEEVQMGRAYDWIVSKAAQQSPAETSHRQGQQNPYLTSEALIQAIRETFLKNDRNGKSPTGILFMLPSQARRALRFMGGWRKFIANHPKVFRMEPHGSDSALIYLKES